MNIVVKKSSQTILLCEKQFTKNKLKRATRMDSSPHITGTIELKAWDMRLPGMRHETSRLERIKVPNQ